MAVVFNMVTIVILFSLAAAKATRKHGPPVFLTPKDFELGEKLRKVQPSPNMPVSPHLFEGDIAGIKDPKPYMEQLHAAMTQNSSSGHANAIKYPFLLWPNATIPYTIDATVNAAARAAVASAIKEIQEKTCVKIVPKAITDWYYVSIERGYGCYAFVGRIALRQPLVLGEGCEYHSVVVHELMHSMGFYHEHSRSDRDQYLTINTSNVKPEYLAQFFMLRLDEATDLNTTFDYDSVMLYGASSFSKNGQPTLQAKQKGKIFGTAQGLSPNDVLKINILYDCTTNGARTTSKAGQCADSNVLCPTWKAAGQCGRNSQWMKKGCKKTCGQC